ncbi:MAG: TatD family hydrolase [Kiritimatiellia bacterium]
MFDAHIHLQDSRLADMIPDVLERALDAHVTGLCCCGTFPQDWNAVHDISERFSNIQQIVVPAFGVHPWYVEMLSEGWMDQLEKLVDSLPVAAVGEIGLDGLRKDVSRDVQKDVLKQQFELAAVNQRPVILHGARAWGDLVDTLKPCADKLPSIIVHGFSGSAEILRSFLDMGAYISFAGSVCNPRAAKVRDAVTHVPDTQLLIETDAPDLFPVEGIPAAMDSKNRPLNQPCNLKLVCETVAALRYVSPDVIADITAANARSALLD